MKVKFLTEECTTAILTRGFFLKRFAEVYFGQNKANPETSYARWRYQTNNESVPEYIQDLIEGCKAERLSPWKPSPRKKDWASASIVKSKSNDA